MCNDCGCLFDPYCEYDLEDYRAGDYFFRNGENALFDTQDKVVCRGCNNVWDDSGIESDIHYFEMNN